MTTASSHPAISRLRSLPVVPAAVLVMVVLRTIQFDLNGSPDEGGFLVLAGQWSSSGHSLYGNYWVDRPPGLMTLFQLADALGGIVALRILGTLFAAASVVLLASTARRVFDERAAAVTAVVAAALLSTSLYGAVYVNGELLALPFLALGIRAGVEAVLSTDVRRARWSAVVAGASAVAALLIKQNMVDVVVFAAVFWVIAWRVRQLTLRQLATYVGLAAVGAVAAYAVVMGWAWAHGTSPAQAYEATYPFRVKAARAIAANPSIAEEAGDRLGGLLLAFLGSGVPFLSLLFLARGVWRSTTTAFTWALIALMAWGGVSVLAGGSYWLHYLVETVPAAALSAGAVYAAAPRWTRGVAAFAAASAVVATTATPFLPSDNPAPTVGEALEGAMHSDDTVVSLFGDAEILRVTGMSSPYEYLWSLPARTRDPDLDDLRGVLEGSHAPTWVVLRGPNTVKRLEAGGAQQVITSRYRLVGVVCERQIYLLDSEERPTPKSDGPC